MLRNSVILVAAFAVLAGCQMLAGLRFDWNSFTPTGKIYEFEGVKYDVYRGLATAYSNATGSDVSRKATVLFPHGTGQESLKTSNVRAVCWDDEGGDCNTAFGKQLGGTGEEGMKY